MRVFWKGSEYQTTCLVYIQIWPIDFRETMQVLENKHSNMDTHSLKKIKNMDTHMIKKYIKKGYKFGLKYYLLFYWEKKWWFWWMYLLQSLDFQFYQLGFDWFLHWGLIRGTGNSIRWTLRLAFGAFNYQF